MTEIEQMIDEMIEQEINQRIEERERLRRERNIKKLNEILFNYFFTDGILKGIKREIYLDKLPEE